jgi:hypothetical protein
MKRSLLSSASILGVLLTALAGSSDARPFF